MIVSPFTPCLYLKKTHLLQATFNSLDAKSIACECEGSTLYTSPNATFIPEPHHGKEELHARLDGCFGTADCFQWPQLYCNEY